jgi:hypothetical protein
VGNFELLRLPSVILTSWAKPSVATAALELSKAMYNLVI